MGPLVCLKCLLMYVMRLAQMMIQINGVFELLRGTTSIEPIDYMGVC